MASLIFKRNIGDLASYFKITDVKQEREYTLIELARMENVRRFLLDNDIVDLDTFTDYLTEIR